jgi:NAD(P)-dependent dehydrogenase (short-subunit alcohol dehydrogenase family)
MAGRSVLVTAATPGTGPAPAPGLTSLGARLAMVRQDLTRTHEVAGDVSAAGGGSVEAFVADLSGQAQMWHRPPTSSRCRGATSPHGQIARSADCRQHPCVAAGLWEVSADLSGPAAAPRA